jgi:hypothetical protein
MTFEQLLTGAWDAAKEIDSTAKLCFAQAPPRLENLLGVFVCDDETIIKSYIQVGGYVKAEVTDQYTGHVELNTLIESTDSGITFAEAETLMSNAGHPDSWNYIYLAEVTRRMVNPYFMFVYEALPRKTAIVDKENSIVTEMLLNQPE